MSIYIIEGKILICTWDMYRGLRSVEAKQLQDQTISQQLEAQQLAARLSEARAALRLQLDKEAELWAQQAKEQREGRLQEKRQERLDRARARAASETEALLAKLREEVRFVFCCTHFCTLALWLLLNRWFEREKRSAARWRPRLRRCDRRSKDAMHD